jgi:rod shape-determining protein MreC
MISGQNKTVWFVLFAVLLGHVMLVKLPTEGRARAGVVRTLILDVLVPIEKVVDVSIHGVGSVWNNYFALLNTRRENETLRRQNSELRMDIDRNRGDVDEAERLRELFDLDPQVNGERVVARVIARDATIFRHAVTIDKGTAHGVHVDAAVITPDGVVGRVIHAAHWSSTVQLVSDPDSAVGVIVESSRVQGVVRGWDNGALRLEHVDDSLDLQPGDWLITSGTDQIYPKGLPFGEVMDLGPVEDLMKTAIVYPAADLGRLEEVLCLINATGATQLIESNNGRPLTP